MGTTRYIVKTEAEILKRIKNLTPTKLFWLRTEIAEEYLLERYTESVAKQLLRTRLFWSWYLRMWEINDKRIIHVLKDTKLEWGELWFYEKMQRTNCEKWDVLTCVDQKEVITNHK